MEFKQSKPKKTDKLESFWNILQALVYQEIKTSSDNFTGGLVYKFLKPVIFTLLISLMIKTFSPNYTLVEGVRFLFLNFLVFFFIQEQITISSGLGVRRNLLNLPKVNFFSLLISQSVTSIANFFPQMIFALFLYVAISPSFNVLNFLEIFLFSWALGATYYINASLIMLNNDPLIQVHDFLTRSLIFISAIFYSPEIIPEEFRGYFMLNPIVHMMEAIRHLNGFPAETYFSINYVVQVIVFGLVLFPIIYFLRIHLLHYGKFKK